VTMGRVALDGTKMKANASLEKNFKRKTLAKKIKKLMEEAKMIDEQEDKMLAHREAMSCRTTSTAKRTSSRSSMKQ